MPPRGSSLPAYRSALFWFRRDLRDRDNAGLYYALKSAAKVLLRLRVRPRDPRCAARQGRPPRGVHPRQPGGAGALPAKRRGGGLIVLHRPCARGDSAPRAAARRRRGIHQWRLRARGARSRRRGGARARGRGRRFHRAKDQVIFEKDEVLTQAGRPFACSRRTRMRGSRKSRTSTCRRTRWRSTPTRSPPAATCRGARPSRRSASSAPTFRDFPVGTGMTGARVLLEDFSQRIDALPAARAISRRSRAFLPLGAQPLRHHFDPRARPHRAGRWVRGRGDLAVGADLARLLFPGAVAPPARRARGVPGALRGARVAQRRAAVCRVVRGAHRLPAGRRRDAPAQRHRLHAQPPAHGGGLVPHQGPAGRLALGRALFRATTSTISTSRPTTAAGSGPPPPAATRSPTSASSTPSRSRRSSTRRASSSAATCPSWRRWRTSSSTRRGPCPPSRRTKRAASSGATTRHRWSTTPCSG